MTEKDPGRRRRTIEKRTPKENRFHVHTALGNGAEFDAIRRMLERWGPHARSIGDDAAVLNISGDKLLVASTDTSVENVHFRRGWLSPRQIGYRALAAALSDLAAMGAMPLGVLVAMVIPEDWRGDLDGISDGIGDAAAASEVNIIGGDMSRGSEMSLGFTVLGSARKVLLRSNLRRGDCVYLTGHVGGSLAALRALEEGRTPDEAHLERFARPVPRIKEAMYLAGAGATGAIDISDGLAADLCHLAVASRVRIVIDLAAVKVADGVSPVDAIASGEEYEIVVTSPVDVDTSAFRAEFGVDLTLIGAVEEGEPGVDFFLNGKEVEVPSGYLHFE